jgi:hypothetical protein
LLLLEDDSVSLLLLLEDNREANEEEDEYGSPLLLLDCMENDDEDAPSIGHSSTTTPSNALQKSLRISEQPLLGVWQKTDSCPPLSPEEDEFDKSDDGHALTILAIPFSINCMQRSAPIAWQEPLVSSQYTLAEELAL